MTELSAMPASSTRAAVNTAYKWLRQQGGLCVTLWASAQRKRDWCKGLIAKGLNAKHKGNVTMSRHTHMHLHMPHWP